MELPGLKRFGTLSPAIPGSPNVAAMGFNPAATQLAVCWEANALDEHGAAFCLDVFDIQNKSRVFTMPYGSRIQLVWAPTSSHLLISAEVGVSLLNMASLECRRLPIFAIACYVSGNRATPSMVWTAKGDIALVCGGATQHSPHTTCFAVLLDGRIHVQFPCLSHGTYVDRVGVRLLPSTDLPRICYAQLVDISRLLAP
ncbi:hypothetical protein WJX74_007838 [Apatococcus lobatus]|uniref:Uncharacterized protein n=1 Tax=Apatococcus lobatus TaxID=904363 RepID=A0AAW1S039_9CHLO